VENLEELGKMRLTTYEVIGRGIDPLSEFIAQAALDAGEAQAGRDHEDSVQLMTLHSAKGLESPLVFMAGVEEVCSPTGMSLEEPGRMEEEPPSCVICGYHRAMEEEADKSPTARIPPFCYGQESSMVVAVRAGKSPATVFKRFGCVIRVTRRPWWRGALTKVVSAKNPPSSLVQPVGQRVMHPKFGRRHGDWNSERQRPTHPHSGFNFLMTCQVAGVGRMRSLEAC